MRFLHSILLLIAAISILSLSSQNADSISSRWEAQDPVYTVESSECNTIDPCGLDPNIPFFCTPGTQHCAPDGFCVNSADTGQWCCDALADADAPDPSCKCPANEHNRPAGLLCGGADNNGDIVWCVADTNVPPLCPAEPCNTIDQCGGDCLPNQICDPGGFCAPDPSCNVPIPICTDGVLLATNKCDHPQCGASVACHNIGRPDPTTLVSGGYCDEHCKYKTIMCPIGEDGLCDHVNCLSVSQECDDVGADSCTSSGYCNNQCQNDPDPDCCQSLCGGNNDWFGGGFRCEQSNCCGDDFDDAGELIEFISQRNTVCNGVCANINDWPEFLPNVNDKACCDATSDAVFDGTCYPAGLRPYKYTPGSGGALGSISPGLPPNVIVVDGNWSDCDAQQNYCEGDRFHGFCDLNWVVKGTGLPPSFGEYDDPSAPECCGDDDGENYRNTSQGSNTGLIACCGNEVDCVDIDGSCVPPGTLSMNQHSNYKCTSGIWSSTSEIVCASIPGEPSRLNEMPICI